MGRVAAALKLVPAIDVKGGVVVHAREGRRVEYKPLRSSKLCNSNLLLEVVNCFRRLGFKEIYLADLDGVVAGTPTLPLLKEICETTDIDLMVDAGTTSLQEAIQLIDAGCRKVVIGTETLGRIDFVEDVIGQVGRDAAICSIDLMNGKILARSSNLRQMEPDFFLQEIDKFGVREAIVLNLDRVGTQAGPDVSLIEKLAPNSRVKLYAAGGIRVIGDLLSLRRAGAHGALLATALHTGAIGPADLEAEGFANELG